ncbi:MAG: DUF2235 domain-containing protein [Acidiferrobacterales bacterium]
MAKNIILCADGTGNRGGYTPDSNVYKIYNAIEIHDNDHPQITFYDNGVGTSKNTYWRALSGAFGFGFKANVCDLYEFLARNYEPGDNVFIFGFSRGAATVRAFSGFIAASGLVDGTDLNEDELQDRIKKAFKTYKVAERAPLLGEHGVIPVKFIGVWDTVSALGFPQDWNLPGIGMLLLNWFFKILEYLSNFVFPHRFYNYELTDNVAFAYQALAIDDERKTFKPMVWHETGNTTVEQVWFAGAHSNVGGGYGRVGVANVALDWMMTHAHHHGLEFKEDAAEKIRRNANVHGRLYNSRDGIAIYYRYHPREIQKFCRSRLRGNVKIHDSVFERMRRKTGNYAPGHLPDTFDMVSTPANGAQPPETVEGDETWQAWRRKVNRWVFLRKWLYAIFLEFTLLVVFSAGWFWINPPSPGGDRASADNAWSLDWWVGHIADILNYISPVYFEGLVTVAVIQHPNIFGWAVLFLIVLWALRKVFRHNNVRACEGARNAMLTTLPASPPKDSPDETQPEGTNE